MLMPLEVVASALAPSCSVPSTRHSLRVRRASIVLKEDGACLSAFSVHFWFSSVHHAPRCWARSLHDQLGEGCFGCALGYGKDKKQKMVDLDMTKRESKIIVDNLAQLEDEHFVAAGKHKIRVFPNALWWGVFVPWDA